MFRYLSILGLICWEMKRGKILGSACEVFLCEEHINSNRLLNMLKSVLGSFIGKLSENDYFLTIPRSISQNKWNF